MKYCISFILLFISSFVFAQLTIVIEEVPQNTPINSTIYLAGNMNNWNPADSLFKFEKKEDGKYYNTSELIKVGTSFSFKLTLGTWDFVEVDDKGNDISNRNYTYLKADTLSITVQNWKDPSYVPEIKSTMSYNVEVMTDSFYMPQLDRYRRIWLYLPPDYTIDLEKDYPVLYMHDGQNVFDASTSFAGEWNVDEQLNLLFEEGRIVPIVIAIDNGGMHRYSEYVMEGFMEHSIEAEGKEYLEFIVNTLKPEVDLRYRTLSDRGNTGIIGSSLGGLISTYAILYHPEVFGLAGLFSPSYSIADSIYTLPYSDEFSFRIYELCGTEESETMVRNNIRMDSLYLSYSDSNQSKLKVVEGGKHDEKLWSDWFSDAILYLYGKE